MKGTLIKPHSISLYCCYHCSTAKPLWYNYTQFMNHKILGGSNRFNYSSLGRMPWQHFEVKKKEETDIIF